MQPFEKIHEYSHAVCDQIKWKKAHPIITEEIENHLIDQRDANINEGTDEATATDNAITQMGDPVIIGTELDRTHRPKSQWGMLLLIATLVCIGISIYIFFMGNTGGYRWIAEFFFLQAIGLGLMTAAYFMDFTWIGRHPKMIYLSLLVFTVVAFFIMKQMETSWGLYYYRDFISLLFPIGFAGIVYSARNKGYKGIVICGIAFLLPAVMMLLMRVRSEFMLFAVSAFVIVCIAIAIGWFRTKKWKAYLLVFIPTAMALLLVAIIILNDSHKLEVIQAAFSPSYDAHNIDSFGATIKMILDGSKFIGRGAMPNGNILGPGYGTGSFLTGLIFHYGWISVMPILGTVLFFIVKGFRLCLKQKNGLALFISMSVMLTFTMQTISYLLSNFGINLFYSFPLPFIIQFDTYAYIINLALIGVMLSVFRTGYVVKDKYIGAIQKHRFISYNNGKLIISLSKK